MRSSTPTAISPNRHGGASRLQAYFPATRPIVLHEILVREEGHAKSVVSAAWGGGADGVFLVGDGIGHQRLLRIARAVVDQNPERFVGVNCRDLRPQDVICRLPAGIHGVWADNVNDLFEKPETIAIIRAALAESGWQGLLVGGASLDRLMNSSGSSVAAVLTQLDLVAIHSDQHGERIDSLALQRIQKIVGEYRIAVVLDKETLDDRDVHTHSAHCVLVSAH